MKNVLTGIGLGAAAAVGIAGLVAGGWALRNLKSPAWGIAAAERAGFIEKQVTVDGVRFNYAAGPAQRDAPPLLLIHGQGADWKNYYSVLAELSEHYRVYAVDVHGHGGTSRTPEKYCAPAVGADLAGFIEKVIKEPTVVAGHSSGGQLAAWLAGHRPEWVRGVVLEDPPLFTTPLPRAEKTWNWVDLATTCHDYLAADTDDWIGYHFANQRLWTFFGDAKDPIVRYGLKQHTRHPGRPITLFFMPPSWNDVQRSLARYDPRFGEAFYTGAWERGFDHEQTLRGIRAPTVFIHANWTYSDDGVLQGALDDDDAERARSMISQVQFERVDSGHAVHAEEPATYIEILVDLKQRLG
ncbi:alpha/beta fold hydrolase [Microlunatus sp. Y2014]|uniref:alpha/beta fold hydrolase n=1 Tax=Microlunatus sp. Y2014 TaxID=3418488 RepID=UPI003DA726EA